MLHIATFVAASQVGWHIMPPTSSSMPSMVPAGRQLLPLTRLMPSTLSHFAARDKKGNSIEYSSPPWQPICHQWIRICWADFILSVFATHTRNVHKARIVFSGKVYSLNPFSGGEREPLGVCSLRYEKQFWERNSLISILLIWYFVVWWCCYKIKYGVEEVRLKKNRSDGHSDLIEHMKAIWTRSSEVKLNGLSPSTHLQNLPHKHAVGTFYKFTWDLMNSKDILNPNYQRRVVHCLDFVVVVVQQSIQILEYGCLSVHVTKRPHVTNTQSIG